MKRRFEVKDGKSNKFWEIELTGTTQTVRWGRIGSTGQEKRSSFASDKAASKDADALVRSKLAKGYREIGGKKGKTPPKPTAKKPYSALYSSVARFEWKHCVGRIEKKPYWVLVFNFEKTYKEQLDGILHIFFELDEFDEYLKPGRGEINVLWAHPVRVPFALVARDPDPFRVEPRDLMGCYGEIDGMLLFDLAKPGSVVLIPFGKDGNAKASGIREVATSVAALQLRESESLPKK